MIIVSALLAVLWTIPYLDHPALAKWLLINTVLAYAVFFVLAGISHVIIRLTKSSKLWVYASVMFAVSFILSFALHIFADFGYQELYYFKTHVVVAGHITAAGVGLHAAESFFSSFVMLGAMTLFWFLTVYGRNAVTSASG